MLTAVSCKRMHDTTYLRQMRYSGGPRHARLRNDGMNKEILAFQPSDMPDTLALERRLQGDLRSDHAGETGAVWIYRGILAVSRCPEVRDFAVHHLETEQRHLQFFEAWLGPRHKSRLLPLWRVAGWLLGALSAAGGRRSVFLTIEAVEAFVVEHYQEQIEYLREHHAHREIRAVLRQFQRDEDHHRLDALERRTPACTGPVASLWRAIVDGGSRLAVAAARRL